MVLNNVPKFRKILFSAKKVIYNDTNLLFVILYYEIYAL